MKNNNLVLAIITQAIRRDIHDPLRYFTHYRVVHFYYEAPYGDMNKDDLASGAKTIQFTSARDLYKKLIKLNPHIIQGAEPYASRKALAYSEAALKAAQKIGAKFIFPMLENRPPESRFGITAPILKKILKYFGKKSTLIFALNSGAKRNLLDVGVDKNKIVSALWGVWGVDTKIFSPIKNGQEPKWNLPTILYVGRLVEEKGISDILEAYFQVIKIARAQLVFVGSGPMEKDINKYLHSGDSRSKIIYLGSKLQRELPPLMRAAALIIAPSVSVPKWEEQIGTVNLQAMACGVPIVSTRSGAIPEFVPDGKVGFLVPEHSPEELAKAILAILTSKTLARRMGKNGYRLAQEKYEVRKNIHIGEKWLDNIK